MVMREGDRFVDFKASKTAIHWGLSGHTEFNNRYQKSDSSRNIDVCARAGCPFRVYAARSSCSLASHSDASLAASSSSLAAGGPDVRPASVVARNVSTAWLHRWSASSFAILVLSRPRVGPGSFLISSRTVAQSLLLTPPLGAVLEKVLPRLDLVLAPPAGGVGSAGGPCEILAS